MEKLELGGPVSGGPIVVSAIPTQQQQRPMETSAMAVASLVVGITGIIILFMGLILGTLAIIFSILAKNKIRQRQGELGGSCMATAGLVLGIISVVFNIFLIVLAIIGANSSDDDF
mmetsp:Transcript_2522/g.3713  ORF Transcript_2522/g.3713 Transcript_2522/m.3713 type:complete len:116 (+) Transcript_2522:112-459(+)|eukprot:CAMPEP_0118702862 /NCGR_PEP_ID=MMETSP0800-20121206/18162_1 /TAXON_ID=210618 ORGANISM="Striatella unipunctata, Strain CCMP2910" /NCGR_SAMPLE_ID=MMETSP0800 /ASSEMBLY_ACC=CAM_ASM_000638 /LENGTH=115 /DNA_ID=CAMNT_0006604181 /DNA_START=108 /DNA_END=455 /DNA_ORIENTATION=-